MNDEMPYLDYELSVDNKVQKISSKLLSKDNLLSNYQKEKQRQDLTKALKIEVEMKNRVKKQKKDI